jgi:hypothetical protein
MKAWQVAGAFLVILAALTGSLSGCRKAVPDRPEEEDPRYRWFEDVTDKVGLDFVHDAGPLDDKFFMPQVVGSGAALFDFNGDGRLDILLLNNGGPTGRPNRLYKQRADGTFQDVSKGSGLDFSGYCMGVAIGDVNNDGRPDVLVTGYRWVRLFLNNGNGTFTDVTREAGLDNPGWGTSAAFVDYDRDGWLDLVVVNYVDYDPSWPCFGSSGTSDYCSPKVFAGTVTRLFRNLGEQRAGKVRFQDVTVSAGLARASGPGLGVVCADLTGDGWPDIFVANDTRPNHLWVNQRDGTFKEEAVIRGVAFNSMSQAQAGMGIGLADVNGDGMLDLVVTHLAEETNTLWVQGPAGLFQDRTGRAGLTTPRWRGTGFGVALADFDHNGWPDLAIANGRVFRAPRSANQALGPHWGHYAERNNLLAHDGQGRFRDISLANPDLCGTPNVARGLAVGDVDGDGALDLLVTTVAGRARLLRNVAPDRGHWLLVRALDPKVRREAYGAEVRVRAGGRTWLGLVNPGGSYLCSNDPRVHFGLGTNASIDRIRVRWPDGSEEEFPGGPADRKRVVVKGKGKRLPPPKGRP